MRLKNVFLLGSLCTAGFGWAFVGFPPLVFSSSGSAVSSAAPPDEPAPKNVVLAAAGRETIAKRIEAIGDTVAEETVVLTPRVAGPVAELFFVGGESVAAGALLVRLDPAEIRSELTAAEAQARELDQAFRRAEQLASGGIGAQAGADDLRRRLEAAEAGVASARERLANFEIRAPFAGRLGLRNISTGTLVQPGDEIVRIDAVDPMKLRFSVPERFLSQVAAGAGVAARSAAYPGQVFEGSVTVVEPRVDSALRTVRVEARLRNEDGRLVPGKLMTVDVTLGDAVDAVVVPAIAVQIEGATRFVFRERDGTAERVEVETGQRLADRIEIVGGLAAGDRIVVEGLVELADGDPIAENREHTVSDNTPGSRSGG